jgi:ketosteroid isomerase-like protein
VLMVVPALMIAAATPRTSDAASLARAVAAYDAAQVTGDRKALQRLLADDYRLANSAGEVQAKASFIADLTDPAFHLNPFTVVSPVEQTWPETAFRGGVARLAGSSGGKPFDACLRFVDVWHRYGSTWRVAYSQATRAPPETCLAPAVSSH